MSRRERRTPWGRTVGERLAWAIAAQGINQKQWGERLGLSESAVSTWLAGGIPDGWAKLRSACEAARCDPAWLLGVPPAAAAQEIREAPADQALVDWLRALVATNRVTVEELEAAVRQLR